MKRFHESVDYIKHRDAKQLFSLTEEVGKMGLLSEEALVDSIESIKINSYKIIRGSSGSRYTTYLIEVYAGQNAWQVSRRYNEFRKLNDELGGLRNLPPLPPKQMFNSFAKEFLDQRKKGLESYLRAMLALPGVRANSSVQNFLIDGRLMLYESASTPSSNYEGEFSFEQEAPSSAIHHMDEMADILDMGDDAVFYSPMSAPREDDESVERRSSGNSSNEENIFRDQAVDFNHTNSNNNNRNDATLQGGPAPQVLGRPPVHPKSVKETKAVYKPKLEDFEIIRVLGKGSFGKVCLCRKRDTGMFYAMKSLKKGHIIKRKQVAHTKTERSVLGQVNHPFIVRLHYAFQSSDKLYFVLDYCSGGELFFHLGRAGRFSEALGRFYAAEIALALGCLHSMGVVYRDLKPENILLDTDGHLKIADFGLSKEGIADAVRGTHSFCGTPEYLAPEVLNRTGHGCAVDWWSLGALLYEMLTGLPPWYSQDRQRMFASIRSSELRFPEYLSPLACEILAAFLQRDVTKRLGSNRDIEEIKEHKFFASIDFDALYRKEITPPFVPRVTSQTDTNNFDATFTRLPINSIDGNISASPQPPLHLSTSMSDEPLFAGFTYTEQPSLDKFMRSKKFTPTSPTNLSSNLMFE